IFIIARGIGPRFTTHLNFSLAPCQLVWRGTSFMNRTRRKHPSLSTFPPARHLWWRAGGKVGALVRISVYIQNSFTCETSSQGSKERCVVQREHRPWNVYPHKPSSIFNL